MNVLREKEWIRRWRGKNSESLKMGKCSVLKIIGYMYRYVDLSGKKRTVYALTLMELGEKEKQVERDQQDGEISP